MRHQELKLPDMSGVNRGLQILLVEDDDVYASLVERMLGEDRRVEKVSRAHDGAEADAFMARSDWPDLIITDLSMPKVGGVALLGKVRETEKAKRMQGVATMRRPFGDERRSCLPVVAMTSSDKAMDFRNVIEAEGNSFVTKPGTAADLRLLLRALVRSVIWSEPLPTILTIEALEARRQKPAESS